MSRSCLLLGEKYIWAPEAEDAMSILLLRGEIIFYNLGGALPAERVPMSITPVSGEGTPSEKMCLRPTIMARF